MAKSKKNYYAVRVGRKPGIYTDWPGENGAEAQVKGFSDVDYKGFKSRRAAEMYMTNISEPDGSKNGKIVIYTDGSCINNIGPGGYGVILKKDNNRNELSGGFRQTTNNRMELMAFIVGLKALKCVSSVVLYSDAKYVVDSINKGLAKRWKANGWRKNDGKHAKNNDLWKQLLKLCNKHNVQFKWVLGHAGNSENVKCDQLAVRAAYRKNLPPDEVYETDTTYFP